MPTTTTVPTPVKYVGSGRFFRNPSPENSPEKCYTILHIGRKIVKYLLIVCFIAGFALIALKNVEYLYPKNNEGGQGKIKRESPARSSQWSSSSSSSFSEINSSNNSIYNHKYIYSISNLDKLRSASQYFKSRDLIITFAEDVDDGYLSIFLNTLREHSLGSEVIVFINQWNVNSKVLQMAQNLRVRFILYVRDKLNPNIIRSYHASSLRYILYSCLLSRNDASCNPGKLSKLSERNNSWISKYFDNVLLVDARDSFFQGDPFSFCKDIHIVNVSKAEIQRVEGWRVLHGKNQTYDYERWVRVSLTKTVSSLCKGRLYTGLETKSGTIGQSSFNSNWIKKCFNERMLALMKNQNIVCSGITFGDSYIVAEYIYKMATVLLDKADALSISLACPSLPGADQGVHNIIVALGSIHNVTAIDEVVNVDDFKISSPFLNLLGSKTHYEHYDDRSDKIIRDKIENFYVSNQRLTSRKLFPVVHQYDRINSLHKLLIKKYVPWVPTEPTLSTLKTYHSCSRFNISIRRTDSSMGKCDLYSRPAMSAERCCNLCSQHRESWIKKITKVKTKKDYLELSDSDKELLSEDFQKNSESVSRLYVHSRKHYLTHPEKYKICTSFTFNNFKCFLKSCGSHNYSVPIMTSLKSSDFLIGTLKRTLIK